MMVQNIEKVLERGEKIEVLVDKTDNLNQSSFAFKKRSTAIRRSMWWKNVRLILAIFVAILALVYLSVCMKCGFPFWKKCFS